MTAYAGRRKNVKACDYSRSHGIGLAVQVDPSGPRAPITYYDNNGPQNGRCLDHDFGYSVRKWRFVSVYHNGRIHDASLPWRVTPLPHPDF